MKRVIFLSVILIAVTLTAGFSNGQAVVKETRDLSGFTKVSFGVAGELYINFGKEFKVVLEGEKSLLEDIVTEVTGSKLVIKKENWRLGINEKVTVYITMPELKGLGVSGSGRAEIKDPVKAEGLDLSVSGSGKINTTDILTSDLNCSISGSGDIIFGGSGDATKADIAISGSGNYSGESLKIGSASISISGSGNCTCNVTESLEASVSGSGNVSYLGNPKVDARVSGSGHIRSK
ncbi:MAG: DUF2807 domain-containing protein [Bacteroidetes bacterium]|nr:MAG: DUF2807 domain-containing protein [Bacteroidota bacterium]